MPISNSNFLCFYEVQLIKPTSRKVTPDRFQSHASCNLHFFFIVTNMFRFTSNRADNHSEISCASNVKLREFSRLWASTCTVTDGPYT